MSMRHIAASSASRRFPITEVALVSNRLRAAVTATEPSALLPPWDSFALTQDGPPTESLSGEFQSCRHIVPIYHGADSSASWKIAASMGQRPVLAGL